MLIGVCRFVWDLSVSCMPLSSQTILYCKMRDCMYDKCHGEFLNDKIDEPQYDQALKRYRGKARTRLMLWTVGILLCCLWVRACEMLLTFCMSP